MLNFCPLIHKLKWANLASMQNTIEIEQTPPVDNICIRNTHQYYIFHNYNANVFSSKRGCLKSRFLV